MTAPTRIPGGRVLVVAQVTLSLGIMATGTQLIAMFKGAGGSAGVPGDRLLIASFDLEGARFTADAAQSFYSRVLEEAARIPGVTHVGIARPGAVWTFGRGKGPAGIVVMHKEPDSRFYPVVVGGYAGGELFEALGVKVLEGRTFTENERSGPPRVAVVNDRFVDQVLQGQNAVGRVIRVGPNSQPDAVPTEVRVVGVIESVEEPRYSRDGSAVPKIYLPSPFEPELRLALYARTAGPAHAVAPTLRALAHKIEPHAPLIELGSLEQVNEHSMGPGLWLARTATLLGGLALLLASAGLYGVVSYLVSMRAREVAIRMALGAVPHRIVTLILEQSMRLVGFGVLIGGLAAYVITQLVRASEFQGTSLDIVGFVGSAAALTLAMLIASAVPALRAARFDPVANLKE